MSGAPLEIPLISAAQTFSVTLVGVTYTMMVHWCAPASCWILDIADQNAVPIVPGIPMITGADLLEPYRYLGIGGQLIVQTDNNTDAVPTFDNLGSRGHLYFVPDA
jgi:uncharacterized protein DUF6983